MTHNADVNPSMLRGIFRGPVAADEPLARHTSMAVGGPAGLVATPADAEDAAALLAFTRREGIPCHVIGRGSNLLAADAGVPGVVMRIADTLRAHRLEKNIMFAGGGVALPALARLAAARGLSGLEFAGGIPGAVGGAVALNAGIREHDMAGVIRAVRVLRPDGAHETLGRDALRFAYRESSLGGRPGVVIEATLELTPGDPAIIRRALDGWMQHRKATQPLSLPNSGSMYRNPPGDFAARLIESVGAKGWREGAAEVSTLHANFIVNRGGATARDVLRLMRREWRAVRDATGIELQSEIHFLGFGEEEEFLPGSQRLVDFSAA
jgi:UDP-N-acetylmuramate dehydrogenase